MTDTILDFERLNKTIPDIEFVKTEDAISKILNQIHMRLQENIKLSLRIDELETRIKELERFQDITHLQYKAIKKPKMPHTCPLCEGSGKVKEVMSEIELATFNCHACYGYGFINK